MAIYWTTERRSMNLSECYTGRYVTIDDRLKGVILGHSILIRQATTVPVVLVELDTGFWSKDGMSYVSVLVTHPDSLQPFARREE